MTNEFSAYNAAQAAFDADPMSLTKLATLETSERAYFSALASAKAKWEAVPAGARKVSAEENANDTAIEQAAVGDELYWHRMAIASLDFVE